MKNAHRILVVDDEVSARTALAELLRDEGFEVATAGDAFKALGKYPDFEPELVLTDLKMPGIGGIELLGRILDRDDPAAVIVMTAHGAVETAVEAMKAGAVDYLQKPLNFDELVMVTRRAIDARRFEREARQLREQLAERAQINNMVGSSPEIERIKEVIRQIAPSRASVLITGESGTGKELVAEAIHHLSPRAKKPFIKLHCAALAESLLESELFGHERGAFTGAVSRHDGRFQLADGGTLFLDEIGEISQSTQVKLLRFLQDREFVRVGGNETLTVDVRVLAATNRDLKAEIAAGRFREDLFYRLNVIDIEVPALRDRLSDIAPLAAHFLEKYAAENDKEVSGFTDQAIEQLYAYEWPGNIRELENAIERAVVLTTGDVIDVDHLPTALHVAQQRAAMPEIPGSTFSDIERHAILSTLEMTGGSTTKAAEILGVSVRKIQYKLHAYNDEPAACADGHHCAAVG